MEINEKTHMKFNELPLEDQIFMLQQELQQAVWTVKFLHECLTKPEKTIYGYPEQTLNRLDEWEKILPESSLCHHSVIHPNCISCKINSDRRHRRKEIEDKLNSENSENSIFHLDSEYKWYDATKTSPSNNVKVIVKLKNGDEIEAWQQFGEWPDGFEVIEWRFK